ncbi:MAG: hypothetical protein HZA91_03160 [Verrucomicrobia bacterium]|nr:hypothetical protein [Verrucomicrobiota bacterium]
MQTRRLLLVIVSVAVARLLAAQEIVRDGAMEKLVLFGPDSAKSWSVAESSLEASAAHVKTGRAALHWHVTVDYYGGEEKYPIGWPRFGHNIPEPMRDWSAWDYFHAWVYTTTSRAALPKEPVGLGIQAPDKAGTYHVRLTELKPGAWVEIKIPVSRIAQPADVRNLQFNISESDYKHGDQLDLWVDDLALLRYAEPTLLEFAAENAVMFAGARTVPVKLQLAGVRPGQRVELACELRCDGRVVARANSSAERGPQRIALDVGGKKLPPGDYELAARVAGNPQPVTAKVRLIESPWRK